VVLKWDPDKEGPCLACNGSGERVMIVGTAPNGDNIYEKVSCPRTQVIGGYVEVDDGDDSKS